MSTQSMSLRQDGFGLKEPTGWFAAGERFRNALIKLSDGSAKLFAWICLEADRRTGRYSATQVELARVLRKSRNSLAKYIAELQSEGICNIHRGRNQHSPTVFEVRDEFWPYHRTRREAQAETPDAYISTIRKTFLGLGCTRQMFSPTDAEMALALKKRGVPLEVVQDALLMGACRKYVSWLNGGPHEPIGSLKYFEAVISEVSRAKLPEGYRGYMEIKVTKWGRQWNAAE